MDGLGIKLVKKWKMARDTSQISNTSLIKETRSNPSLCRTTRNLNDSRHPHRVRAQLPDADAALAAGQESPGQPPLHPRRHRRQPRRRRRRRQRQGLRLRSQDQSLEGSIPTAQRIRLTMQ